MTIDTIGRRTGNSASMVGVPQRRSCGGAFPALGGDLRPRTGLEHAEHDDPVLRLSPSDDPRMFPSRTPIFTRFTSTSSFSFTTRRSDPAGREAARPRAPAALLLGHGEPHPGEEPGRSASSAFSYRVRTRSVPVSGVHLRLDVVHAALDLEALSSASESSHGRHFPGPIWPLQARSEPPSCVWRSRRTARTSASFTSTETNAGVACTIWARSVGSPRPTRFPTST
jgi:hypothetical protein